MLEQSLDRQSRAEAIFRGSGVEIGNAVERLVVPAEVVLEISESLLPTHRADCRSRRRTRRPENRGEFRLPVEDVDAVPLFLVQHVQLMAVVIVRADQRVAALDVIGQVRQARSWNSRNWLESSPPTRPPKPSTTAKVSSPRRPGGRYPRRKYCPAESVFARQSSASIARRRCDRARVAATGIRSGIVGHVTVAAPIQ